MLSVNCTKCSNGMSFNETDGTFICKACSITRFVTDIELPQLGSCRNSVYHPDKAAGNVSEASDTIQYNGIDVAENESMIINNSIDENEAVKIYRKWSRHGLFTPHKINSAFRDSGLNLKYIPAFLYNITGYGSLNSTTAQFSESLSRKERITTTDYYSLERGLELQYGNFATFSSDMHFMNSINDYSYDNIDIIKNEELPENIVSQASSKPSPIPENVSGNILDKISSTLDDMTKEYSTSYTEEKKSDISITPIGQIFVPVWHFSYGKTNRHEIYINAQTGSVYGTPIVSRLKTLFAITIPSIILSIIFSLLLLSPNISKAADNITASVSNNVPVVDDRADLFTDYEEVSILDKAKQQRDQTGFQYIIVTTDKIERGSLTDELEYVYNSCREDISSNGTVLFLIYNNNGSFECELQGYTMARDYIPHETCDNIESRLNNYDATGMIEHLFDYLTEVSDGTYIYADEPENSTSYSVAFIILIIISCIILTGILILYLIPKKSVSSDIVLPEPELHITLKKDIYIRTHEKIYKL